MNINKMICIMIAFLLLLLILSIKNTIKIVSKLCINSILGSCFLLIVNTILSSNGLLIGLNFFTIIFTGILGIPGVICLYILKIIL